jgi:hypothetical protein
MIWFPVVYYVIVVGTLTPEIDIVLFRPLSSLFSDTIIDFFDIRCQNRTMDNVQKSIILSMYHRDDFLKSYLLLVIFRDCMISFILSICPFWVAVAILVQFVSVGMRALSGPSV